MNARFGSGFECRRCGSPAVSIPAELTDLAIVRCGNCQAEIANWRTYRARISAAVRCDFDKPPADPLTR